MFAMGHHLTTLLPEAIDATDNFIGTNVCCSLSKGNSLRRAQF